MNFSATITFIFVFITLIALIPVVILGLKRNLLQAGVKLAFVLVGIVVAGLFTYYFAPVILVAVLGSIEKAASFFEYIASGSAAAQDLTKLLSALFCPLLFLAFFIVIEILFTIGYAVLSKLLLSRKLQNVKGGARAGMRAGGIILSFIAGFLIVSSLTLPLSYYGSVIGKSADIVSGESAKKIVKEASDDLTENVFHKVYYSVGRITAKNITSIKSRSGYRTTADEVLESVSALAAMNFEEITATQCYRFAGTIERNAFTDELIGGILSDAAGDWKDGEAFFGIEPVEIVNESVTSSVYDIFIENTLASVEFYGVGNVLSVQTALSSDAVTKVIVNEKGEEEEILVETSEHIYELANNVTAESASVAKRILAADVIESMNVVDSQNAQSYSDAVSHILDGLVSVRDDAALTEEERDAALIRESEKIAVLSDVSSGIKTIVSKDEIGSADAPEGAIPVSVLVEAISASPILQKTTIAITHSTNESGESVLVTNPLGIADRFDEKIVQEMKDCLEDYGITKEGTPELYDSILAMLSQ